MKELTNFGKVVNQIDFGLEKIRMLFSNPCSRGSTQSRLVKFIF